MTRAVVTYLPLFACRPVSATRSVPSVIDMQVGPDGGFGRVTSTVRRLRKTGAALPFSDARSAATRIPGGNVMATGPAPGRPQVIQYWSLNVRVVPLNVAVARSPGAASASEPSAAATARRRTSPV